MTDAVDAYCGLRAFGARIDVAACQPHELRYLTAGVRDGQQALDALLMQIGAAADTHSERGEDAVGLLLGDGPGVRGLTARREAERARTAAGLTRVGAAVAEGLIGAAQVDAITNAAKNLSPEERQQLDCDEIVNAAASLPVDRTPLLPESIARLACDAVLQRVVIDKHRIPLMSVPFAALTNRVSEQARKHRSRHRTATDAQWQSLRALYRTCAWTGCGRPLAWCQAHHVHEWDHGGRTDLCNLIPLCSRHHHAVHEGGWTVKLTPGYRRLDIHHPDRTFHATTFPDRPVPSNATRRRTGHRSGRARSPNPGSDEPARSGSGSRTADPGSFAVITKIRDRTGRTRE